MKRYHLTTFGCQMNEHDSERMKGMLESLGYSEAAVRNEADLILFNTCSIRERADERFISHLGEAKRVKSERPDVVVGVGGCWAQSVKEEVFERFPFVDVAFGPGPQAGGVPHQRLAERPGVLRVRRIHGPAAGEAGARVPGVGTDQRRL
jgi:tRNA A37 methylthiotransferase MiaB